MSSPEPSERRIGPLIAWLVFVGILVLVGYAARLSGTETPSDLAYRWSSSIAAVIQYWLFLVVIVTIALVSKLNLRETFALRRPPSWPKAAGLAALCLLVIYLASFVYERALSLFGDWSPTDEQGLVPDGWDSSRAAPFVAFFLVVTLVAPAVEELTYRGLGISLVQPWGVPLAIVSTGVLFGAAHGLFVGFPILAFFGIVVGWLRVRTNSIYPSIALHATFNGIALLVSVSGAA
jgi:membrane protease YdiL (CAAX protease family)